MGFTISVAKKDDGVGTLHQFGEVLCAQQRGAWCLTVCAQDKRAAPPDRHQPCCDITEKSVEPALFLAEVSAAVEATEAVDVRRGWQVEEYDQTCIRV